MRYFRGEIEAIRELEEIAKKQGERIGELEAEVNRLNRENFWLNHEPSDDVTALKAQVEELTKERDALAAEVEDLENSFDVMDMNEEVVFEVPASASTEVELEFRDGGVYCGSFEVTEQYTEMLLKYPKKRRFVTEWELVSDGHS